MRFGTTLAVAATILFFTPADCARAQFGLVTLPLDDPAYAQLAALERLGCAAARVSPNRPYETRAIRAALSAARAEPACSAGAPILAALRARFALAAADTTAGLRAGGLATVRATGQSKGVFSPLWDNVRPTGAGDPPVVGLVEPRVTWGDGHTVAAVVDGIVQSSVRNDPVDRSRADLRDAYVTVGIGAFSASVGRTREAWLGDGTDSYALSAHGVPFDRLALGFRTAHFEGHAIYGLLNDVVLDSVHDAFATGIGRLRYARYLAAHALTWRPGRAVELTVGETAVISRGAHGIDFYYLNPFVPYVVLQNDTGRTGDDARDNLMAFGAVRTRLGPATLDAELYIDDIQIDAASRATTPDQLGLRLAAAAPLPISSRVPMDAEVDYRRSDSYLYMRRYYTEVQQYWGEPIGSELGPDADYLRLNVEALPAGVVRLAADVGRWRRGLLRITDRPADAPTGHAGTPFPSQVAGRPVQTAYLGGLSAQLLDHVVPVTLSVRAARITNLNNVPSPAALYVQTQLSMTYAFRYP